MTEAQVAAICVDKVTKYLEREFRLEAWEARPIAAETVILVLEELKEAKVENE